MIRGDKKDSDILRHYCQALATSIDQAGRLFKNVNQRQQTYLDLLRRIRCSLLGVVVQLAQCPEIIELKLPISLAFRTALTDALTGLYLATFHEEERAFQHELMVLDLAYFNYVKTIFEHTALEMPGASAGEIAQEEQDRWATLYTRAEHLLRSPGQPQLKSPETLRDVQHHALFQIAGGHTRPLSEKDMFNQIKTHPATRHLARLYIVQRHLSQQHHYAPANRDFIQLPPAIDCRYWFEGLVYIIEVSGLLMGLLEVPQPIRQALGEEQVALLDLLADRTA
jgi:hypothetical protein